MQKSRSIFIGSLVILFLLGSGANATGARVSITRAQAAGPASHTPTASAAVQVSLAAADRTTSWDSSLPEVQPFDLPVLYLHRNGEATDEAERTLTVNVSGLAGGTAVEAEIVSWHEDPSTQQQLRQTRRFSLPEGPCSPQQPCPLRWVLDTTTVLSDLYRLTLRDSEGHVLWENPQPGRPDFAVLDTWEAAIDGYTVRVTYGALFPFARGEKALDQRLPPDAVHEFISQQFLPIFIETWKTQLGAWGFGPIHPGWDGDKVVEIILTCAPFALFGGTGTYTVSTYADGSPYPERRMWVLSNDNTLRRYDSLENGFRVIVAHEFFHMAQWNVRLAAGCPTNQWMNTFIESQGKFAVSVQYPEIELSRDHLTMAHSEYSGTAQRFLELRLKTSYAALEAEETDRYDAALYWRFLYEQTAGDKPFGGMAVIRAALEEMACRPIADIPTSLDEVMDAALARLGGPIQTFEQSLVAFGQANYALRLEDGRCTAADLSTCDGKYYDPQGMYTAPLREAELPYRGSRVVYQGSIPASYGTDLIEVPLDPALHGQPMTVTFRSEGARFSVQAWTLHSDGNGARDPVHGKTGVRAVTPQPETLSEDCSAGCRYTIPSLDPAQADGRGGYSLALIVVRLDPHEEADPAGAYQIVLDAAR